MTEPKTDSLTDAERVFDLQNELLVWKRRSIGGLFCALLLLPALFFGLYIGEKEATKHLSSEERRPMTRGEDVYIHLARMGFVDWTMACTYAVAKKAASWEEAKQKCSSDYLDRIRDMKDGDKTPSPEEFALEKKAAAK